MFVFHCNNCQEKFRIELENFNDKLSLSCPNCGLQFPQEALDHLRNLSSSYRAAIDAIKTVAKPKESWSLTIDAQPYMRPQPVIFPGDVDTTESYWDSDLRSEISKRRIANKK